MAHRLRELDRSWAAHEAQAARRVEQAEARRRQREAIRRRARHAEGQDGEGAGVAGATPVASMADAVAGALAEALGGEPEQAEEEEAVTAGEAAGEEAAVKKAAAEEAAAAEEEEDEGEVSEDEGEPRAQSLSARLEQAVAELLTEGLRMGPGDGAPAAAAGPLFRALGLLALGC
jgi:hypothetical protein